MEGYNTLAELRANIYFDFDEVADTMTFPKYLRFLLENYEKRIGEVADVMSKIEDQKMKEFIKCSNEKLDENEDVLTSEPFKYYLQKSIANKKKCEFLQNEAAKCCEFLEDLIEAEKVNIRTRPTQESRKEIKSQFTVPQIVRMLDGHLNALAPLTKKGYSIGKQEKILSDIFGVSQRSIRDAKKNDLHDEFIEHYLKNVKEGPARTD